MFHNQLNFIKTKLEFNNFSVESIKSSISLSKITKLEDMHNWQCLEIFKSSKKDSSFFSLSGFKNNIFLMNLQDLQIMNEMSLPEPTFSFYRMELNIVIVGGSNSLMVLFVDCNCNNVQLLGSFRGHERQINCIQPLRTQEVIVSGSSDGHIAIWKHDKMYQSLQIIGKVNVSHDFGPSIINSIIKIPKFDILVVSNDSDQIFLFHISSSDSKITEFQPFGGFASKISSMNHMKSCQSLILSHHSSKVLYELDFDCLKS